MINRNKLSIETEESERIVPYVLIFDVDGVLTHPSEKRVAEPGLFPQLIERLEAGVPLVLNTGRTADFMIKKIIDPLEKLVGDKKLLKNLFAVGEKGAVSVQYDILGERTEHIDRSISVPEYLQIEAMQLVKKKFSEVAFYDNTKKTMISIEMHDGFSVDEFRKKQGDLNSELEKMLEQHGLSVEYKVDPSRIATDVENGHVGKGLGVRKALEWLAEKKIRPEKFIAFGDSPADVEMAVELHRRNLPVQFVFVGEKALLAGKKLKFPIIYTIGQCEIGTMEYLKNLD